MDSKGALILAGLLVIVVVYLLLGMKGGAKSKPARHHGQAPTAHVLPGTLVRVGNKYVSIEEAVKSGAVITFDTPKNVPQVKTDYFGRPLRK